MPLKMAAASLGRSFDPSQLATLSQAFDHAWDQVSSRYVEQEVPEARLRLAEAVLNAADSGPLLVDRLVQDAIRRLCRVKVS